ncbi:peptidase M, neutral zinc metallopeptidase site [Anabaena sphaerica FACHB-251]|uniref:Peptidase M, neutral zinc metallopeptidase site n=1 Tax=Anabaena sphaerica FACHB-251 TaxID=2692883 RepID=A0A926WFI6_9NOST|nr:peptidase M, neutral zinc metallopeptidase site [Anabaena sphaerica]MBD2293502.1 peptidase M, neutral zinc metallopeptidase site [Anabaena sphaerica FACHB-251]
MSILDSLKEASQKAAQQAQKKQLREAVTTAETALNLWAKKTSLWERLLGKLLIGNLVDTLEQQLVEWRKKVAQADKLAAQAQVILKDDPGDPLETRFLTSAIALYRLHTQIISDESISQVIEECKQVLKQRQQFQLLLTQAKSQAENLFFKNAIAIYKYAETLYPTGTIKQAISDAQTQVFQEEIYNSALQKAQQAESKGKLRVAIALLDSALSNFPRTDGFDLLQKLKSKVKAQELFFQGLAAEKAGDFPVAQSLYESAKSLLQNPTDCQIRLGLVAIKMQDWANALSHLQNLSGEQAAYLRGFALAQQGNLQSAYREWQVVSALAITEQREILKRISQHQRLLSLQNIEQLVNAKNLEQAQTASRKFIQKFGANALVEGNLTEYIEPSIEAAVWENSDWTNIANHTKNSWILNPNMTTLHNWTIATYYHTQSNPEQLFDLIIALSTSLANLTADSSLKDVPWLVNKAVDFNSVSLELKRRLEAAIENIKNINLEDYLNLRDLYRWELVSLRFMGEPANSGMQINDVFITPGCYRQFLSQWQNNLGDKIHSSQKILSSLYTSWGLAVAACLEGDSPRAIQIKPVTNPTLEIEKFAQNFVAYHEGCYQLQQQEWRKAIITLQSAKAEIKYNQNWQQEIDRLCGLQRQAISEFKENLEFAEFWYDIVDSKSARSYFAEYKSEDIRQQLLDEQISLIQALGKLQELKNIDSSNPIVIDMIENVELSQELKEINRLFQTQKYEEMLSKAKLSTRDRIRYIVADFFLDMLVKGIKEERLHDPQLMLQLGRWAYEICPHEPAFQEIYRSLKLC